MKYCANCFRFSLGQPPYCNFCGRSYTVRLCKRGHPNARNAEFCAECGSNELSLAAPPETFLSKFSRISVQLLVGLFVGLTILSLVFALFLALDWSVLGPRLVLLGVLVWVAYRATTLLPGPVKRLGSTFIQGSKRKYQSKGKR